jgi:hypothetical protein
MLVRIAGMQEADLAWRRLKDERISWMLGCAVWLASVRWYRRRLRHFSDSKRVENEMELSLMLSCDCNLRDRRIQAQQMIILLSSGVAAGKSQASSS